MREFLAFALLLWIPPILIILKSVLWNLAYWHKSEYRIENLYNYLRWDYNHANRFWLVQLTKFILFGFISAIFISPIISLVAALLVYCIWIFELFAFVQKILYKNFISYRIFDARPLAVSGILIVSLLILFWFVSYPFLILERTVSGSGATLLTLTAGSPLYLLDVFLFIGISASILLFLDLASSLITGVLVVISGVFTSLYNQIALVFFEERLKTTKKNPNIILLVGDWEITILEELLKIIMAKLTEASFFELKNNNWHSVLKNLANVNGTVVIKVLSNSLSGNILRIIGEIDPIILIYGKTKDFEKISSKLKPTTEVILLNPELSTKHLSEKLFHSTITISDKKESSTIYANIKLEKGKKAEFIYKEKDLIERSFTINTSREYLEEEVAAAVYLLHNFFKLSYAEVSSVLSELNMEVLEWNLIEGDNDTRILYPYKNFASVKSLQAGVNYATNFLTFNRIILITDGFLWLGENKRQEYLKLKEFLDKKIDFLLTTESLLVNKERGLESFQSVKLVDLNDAVFWVRENSQKGDLIIFEGPNTKKAAEMLSSSYIKI